jgi:hypothetical protein
MYIIDYLIVNGHLIVKISRIKKILPLRRTFCLLSLKLRRIKGEMVPLR